MALWFDKRARRQPRNTGGLSAKMAVLIESNLAGEESLANKADLHPVNIRSLEGGQENVSSDSLAWIARAMKVTLGDLVNEV